MSGKKGFVVKIQLKGYFFRTLCMENSKITL